MINKDGKGLCSPYSTYTVKALLFIVSGFAVKEVMYGGSERRKIFQLAFYAF